MTVSWYSRSADVVNANISQHLFHDVVKIKYRMECLQCSLPNNILLVNLFFFFVEKDLYRVRYVHATPMMLRLKFDKRKMSKIRNDSLSVVSVFTCQTTNLWFEDVTHRKFVSVPQILFCFFKECWVNVKEALLVLRETIDDRDRRSVTCRWRLSSRMIALRLQVTRKFGYLEAKTTAPVNKKSTDQR